MARFHIQNERKILRARRRSTEKCPKRKRVLKARVYKGLTRAAATAFFVKEAQRSDIEKADRPFEQSAFDLTPSAEGVRRATAQSAALKPVAAQFALAWRSRGDSLIRAAPA